MKIYIEHDKEFYDYSGRNGYSNFEHFINNINRWLFPPCRKTDKRDFEIGARVYFENVGWTEVIRDTDYCIECIFQNTSCDAPMCYDGGRSDNTDIVFKKLDLAEKQEEPKQTEQFYVLNTKTGVTNFIHESEESAKTEAARLASKQPEEDEDALTEKRQLVYDADKEAAGMKDEKLDALIELYHEHAAVECNSCSAGNRPNLCVAVCRCIYENARHVIERATGLTIDEAIKAWEARNEK